MDTPFTFPCGLQAKNRIGKPAMSEAMSTREGRPTEENINLYRVWGKQGGAGLLITGNLMVDRRALETPRNMILENDKHLASFARLAAAAKSGGSLAIVQISHPGRNSTVFLKEAMVAPSAVPLKLPLVRNFPRAMTLAEIDDVIERFATSAELVVKAGFDGVQIHGAHGYLLSQFLSPLVNQRNDEYGGDSKRRMALLLKVVQVVRKRIGQNKLLSVKLNSADFQRGGFDEEDSLNVIRALENSGVDLLEISGGNYESPAMVGVHKVDKKRESTHQREAYFAEFAAKVREVSAIPLMLSGGVRTKAFGDHVIGTGEVDLIGIARPFAMAPDAGDRIIRTGTLTDLPALNETGIKFLDALVQSAWHQRLMQDIGHNRSNAQTLTWNPYLLFLRAALTLLSGGATQFHENDWKLVAGPAAALVFIKFITLVV